MKNQSVRCRICGKNFDTSFGVSVDRWKDLQKLWYKEAIKRFSIGYQGLGQVKPKLTKWDRIFNLIKKKTILFI